ncbi:MAG TPA: membrane protein insertase YidC [Stellaceae bacterium]|nr:membrane protein insertase YidC [Stellaceae bacterium]
MDEQQRNLFIAIALSLAILFVFQFWFAPRQAQQQQAQQAQQNQSAPATPVPEKAAAPPAPAPGMSGTPPAHAAPRADVLGKAPRVTIATPRLNGSIDLNGARIDDLTLVNYHETVDPKSPEIVLLAPEGSEQPYFVELGWVASDAKTKLPGPDTKWTGQGALAPDHPLDLTWDNGEGLTFTRRIAIDPEYMFSVTQTVVNHGAAPVTLLPYGLVQRSGEVPVSSTYLLHEGPIGVFNGTLQDGYKYADLKSGEKDFATVGGWMGFTDKYWLVSLIPDLDEPAKARMRFSERDNTDVYQVDYTGGERVVAPGGTASATTRIFAGAKEVALLDRYEAQGRVPRFDRAIDFGWFYFLTKPIFLTLDFFYHLIGNFGLAIMLLTVLIKLLFFPLANKSYRAMSKMKLLQPEMAKLRERFGDDKQKINQEMMALYKRVGANPMAGCLPIVIQIPVFFSLYKTLYVTIEMRHAPFYGWIHDLSAPDPTTFVNLFGLIPFTPPDISFLHIGAWPLIMGCTMFLQQKLNPQPPDPMQAKMFMILPVVFTFMLAPFAAGLVIYWSWNNLLSIAQQWLIMRQARPKT